MPVNNRTSNILFIIQTNDSSCLFPATALETQREQSSLLLRSESSLCSRGREEPLKIDIIETAKTVLLCNIIFVTNPGIF